MKYLSKYDIIELNIDKREKMLIDYTVSNYRSIYEEQSFNMVAVNSYKEMTDTNLIEYKSNMSLLKSTAIYGPNASGKSTLLESLDVLRGIVLSSFKFDIDDELPVVPFAFAENSKNEPTMFEITFVENEIKYEFELVLNKERVLEEYLTAYPKGQPQAWYSRVYNEISELYEYEYSSLLRGKKKTWESTTKKNVLFISTAINLQNDEDNQLMPIYNWFKNKLTPVSINGWSNETTKELCLEKKSKDAIVHFLQLGGIDIKDINIDIEKRNSLLDAKLENPKFKDIFSELETLVENELSQEDIARIKRNIKITFVHSNGMTLDLKEQSDGTKKLFSFASLWLQSLKDGKVLFCDELNDNLHPALVKLLVDLFNDDVFNTNNAQLIFTTHETSILNQEVLRRDQVWFCERDDDLSTKVYPLSDFAPRKDIENIEDSYLTGRYGALPYFKKISYKMNFLKD